MSKNDSVANPEVDRRDRKRRRPIRNLSNTIIGGWVEYFWGHTEKFTHLMQIIFFIIGATWAFYTFVYEAKIKPSEQPPQMIVTGQLEQIGRNGSMISLRATLQVKNPGKDRVIILAAYYNLIGYDVKETSVQEQSPGRYIERQESRKIPSSTPKPLKPCQSRYDEEINASKFYKKENVEFINAGNLLIGWQLDPDDQYTREYVFYVPDGKYNTAQLRFDTYITKDYQWVKWQNVTDHMQARIEYCPSGEIDAVIQVKDYCRFCDLGKQPWVDLYLKDDEYKKRVFEQRDFSHSDYLEDMPLLPAPSSTRTPQHSATSRRDSWRQ